MSGQFRFLDDIALADVAFEATGATPTELFQAAADAVIHTMVDPLTVSVGWSKTLHYEESSLEALLFEWLSAVVYWKDAAGVVYHEACSDVSSTTADRWELRATLRGESVDGHRHELRADVKAVTKHLYRLSQTADGWTATVVLDI
jgi:SHS2 domain-containing protein